MEAIIVDGHEDIAMALLSDESWDFGAPAHGGHGLSLADAKRGGIGLILATIFAPDGYWPGETASSMGERQVELYDDLLRAHQEDLFRVESRGDLALCQIGGPIGIVHLMEGADPIRSPRDLARWANRGVRIVAPAWNTGNRYCGGWNDNRRLTADGRHLIAEMRKRKVVPDLSHLKPEAFEDVLAVDTGLVVASHSNAYALHPHRRNLTDAQIRAVADRDGLVGIVLFDSFLGEGQVTLDTVLAHIQHMVDLVGPDHVGFGTDLDGGFTIDRTPEGFESVADLRRIGEALDRRGYTADAVQMILGGNCLPILRQALPA